MVTRVRLLECRVRCENKLPPGGKNSCPDFFPSR